MHQLLGVWEGSDHPLQKTILAFFPSGQGLLFFYYGSMGGTPFLDEFRWSAVSDNALEVKWQVLHDYDDKNVDEEGPRSLVVKSDIAEEAEEVEFNFVDGQLDITIGMHDCYWNRLSYAGSVGDYQTAYHELSELVANYNPFNYAWHVDGNSEWHEIQLDSDQDPAEERLISLNMLGLIVGVLGQVAFLSDYCRNLIPEYIRFPLHFMPLLLFLLRSDSKNNGFLGRAVNWSRSLASAWYIAISTGIIIAAIVGCRPRGWEFYLALIIAGLYPCISVFRRRRYIKHC